MYKNFIKVLIDDFVSLLIFPFWVVIFVFVSIAIKMDDGGPIFYYAKRLGKDGKVFKMLKFRSMKVNSENIMNSDGNTFNSKDDPRVTRVGRFLRETSLDETPQIINILKGDMSLIGPRASNYDALPLYQEDELDKLKVRPGISGYNQAYFRNSLSAREKRLNDVWYAHHISLMLDTKIIFKTILTVIKRDNIYSN